MQERKSMMSNMLKDRKIDAFTLLLCLAFCQNTLLSYLVEIIRRIPFIGMFSRLVVPGVFAVLFLLSYKTIISKIKLLDVAFILSFLFLTCISPIISQNNYTYVLKNFPSIFTSLIPFYILGRTLQVDGKTKKWLLIFAEISILVAWAYYFYHSRIMGRRVSSDSMSWSYAILPHVLIVVWALFNNHSIWKILFSIAGGLYVLFMGTRGPALILLLYIAIMLLISSRSKKNGLKFLYILLFAFGVAIIVNDSLRTDTLYWFRDLARSLKMSTRIFDKMLQESVQDSARQSLYQMLLNQLDMRPLLGYGLYGEYYYTGGTGAHNFLIQLLFEFGYFFGFLLIALFFYVVINSYIVIKREKDQASFLLLWLCYIIIHGLISGSIFNSITFFALGLMFNFLTNYKKNPHYNVASQTKITLLKKENG